ncbi:MAG TPA: RIO1 family regulatory kinase/ATPase [Herpetosiphonaceae bacterium]|nr:RIO1 family regulatory kinase/ATPase [Herpetosiphonaceae bacterium]
MPRYIHESDADSAFEPIRPKTRRVGPPPALKQSFEQNADVQRWLVEQTRSKKPGEKPPFDPPFLSGHHERVWLLSSLERFYQLDLITDVHSVAKSGKEATVYCCTADPSTGYALLAAKTYRPRMFRSLKNDAVYRQNRAALDSGGNYDRHKARRAGGERGRAMQVAAWIQHEYLTQARVQAAGATVPAVLGQAGNAILMEYFGDEEAAAPLLQHVRLHPADAPALFAGVMRDIERCLSCHCIHGDLSAYNMLYWEGRVILIDFAQAVDPRYNIDVFDLLERDIDRVCAHFARYGVRADAHALASELWSRYLMGDLAA